MKRLLKMIFSVCVVVCLMFLWGCGEKNNNAEKGTGEELETADLLDNPYEGLDLSEYVTLPDYESFRLEEPQPEEITAEDVEKEIEERLEPEGKTKKITRGKVKKGDKINISFKGTLEDGSTVDGINSESLNMTVGEEDMVEGFQEAIIGKNIGDKFVIDLKFPENYTVLNEISGHTVTFDITVNYKYKFIPASLTEEYVKKNSDAQSIEEYKRNVEEELKKNAYEVAVEKVKNNLYSQIEEKTEMLQIYSPRVTEYYEQTKERYREIAKNQGMEWEDFINKYFTLDAEEFDIQLQQYSREMVKQEEIIYSLVEKEGIGVSEKELEEFMKQQLQNSGYTNEEAFEAASGMTLKEYVKRNNLVINIYLNKALTQIYERLS